MTGKLPSIKRPHLTFPILPEKEEKENQFHATFFSFTGAHFDKSSASPQTSRQRRRKKAAKEAAWTRTRILIT
jgi:hypothetical protein